MSALVTVTILVEAQDCIVSGVVRSADSAVPLEGVIISTSNGNICTTTDSIGHYLISFPMQNVVLRFSHVGYCQQKRTVNGRKGNVILNVALQLKERRIDDVVVLGTTKIAVSRGDTTVYRVGRVNRDETVGEAVSRIPGFRYEQGQLEINGEKVTQLMLDGKEFFKGDANIALKNLHANIIEQIEVFDKKNDYAELSGFDDGHSSKAVNIRTRGKVYVSKFGKAYAGIGTSNRYQLYGMFSSFKKDMRLSVFTQFNNINEQNFSMIDLLSATGTASSTAPTQSPYNKNSSDNTFHPTASDDISSMLVDVSQGGVTISRAVGSQYSDSWAKGKMEVSGHYLFNSSTNNTNYGIYDEYFGKNTANNRQQQNVNTDNLNHRFNWKYEYKTNNGGYLMIRPSLTYQRKRENSTLTDWTIDDSMQDLLLNQTSTMYQTVFGTADEIMYLHKISPKGHTLSVDGRFSYMKTNENIGMNFENVQASQKAIQETYSYNIQKTFTAMISYVHSLSQHSKVKVEAGWNVTCGLIKRKTRVKADDAQVYSLDSLLCGTTNSDFGGFRGNLSYMYGNKNLNMVVGTELNLYGFKTTNDISKTFYKYNKLLPFVVMRYRFGGSQIHLQYRSAQKYPGLIQAQDAINNANAIMAVRGNSRLQAAIHRNMMLRLLIPDVFVDGSVSVAFANLEQADNYIASRRSLSSSTFTGNGNKRNSEMFSYQNADGFLSISGLLAYAFPISSIKSNINISSMISFAKIPGFWDEEKSYTNSLYWNSSVTMASKNSDQLGFIVDLNCKYNKSKNINYTDFDVKYWSISYGGQLSWYVFSALKLVIECGHTRYFGAGTSRFNAIIANASVAWLFMKNRKCELKLSCNDIFNQNNNFFQTTNEIYRREVTSNVLKRYAMLTFIYNIN